MLYGHRYTTRNSHRRRFIESLKAGWERGRPTLRSGPYFQFPQNGQDFGNCRYGPGRHYRPMGGTLLSERVLAGICRKRGEPACADPRETSRRPAHRHPEVSRPPILYRESREDLGQHSGHLLSGADRAGHGCFLHAVARATHTSLHCNMDLGKLSPYSYR